MSSSDTSSAPSPSPPASPEASFQGPPSLERLVGHYVSAKRSLNSASYVWRANELVTSSRTLVEEIAVLNARNAFARQGVDEQLDTLHALRDGVAVMARDAAVEFETTIAKLDEANDRLQGTLKSLRKTLVDSSLQRTGPLSKAESVEDPSEQSRVSEEHSQKQQTLYDFIEESRHVKVLDSLHGLIDSYNEARAEMNSNISSFDAELKQLADTLQEGSITGSGPQDKRTIYDEPPPTVSQLFRGMEQHAVGMAGHLNSLTAHYDLCVSALKHTEGGGQAAKLAVQQADELSVKAATADPAEESLYRKTVAEPISDDDRTEMLRVVEGDAPQVEDVMGEITEHASEMEKQYEHLSKHATASRSGHKMLKDVLRSLHQRKAALPGHVNASRIFREAWQDIQVSIQAKTAEVVELTSFYDSFLGGYSKVLDEVERRQGVETQMKKIAAKAQRELDKLHEADRDLREDFVATVGGYLPRDIWPGVGEEGVRWEIRKAGKE